VWGEGDTCRCTNHEQEASHTVKSTWKIKSEIKEKKKNGAGLTIRFECVEKENKTFFLFSRKVKAATVSSQRRKDIVCEDGGLMICDFLLFWRRFITPA
jgi:hypothetical protein